MAVAPPQRTEKDLSVVDLFIDTKNKKVNFLPFILTGFFLGAGIGRIWKSKPIKIEHPISACTGFGSTSRIVIESSTSEFVGPLAGAALGALVTIGIAIFSDYQFEWKF